MNIIANLPFFLTLILCLIIIGYTAYHVSSFEWREQKEHADVLLTFEELKNFYALNPQHYTLYEPDRYYYIAKYWLSSSYLLDPAYSIAMATYADWRKYARWYKKMQKYKEQEISLQKTQNFLKEIQRDIDNRHTQALKEIEKSTDLLKEMLRNDQHNKSSISLR